MTERIFVIPDTHVPYQDNKAWRLCLKAIKEIKPDKIVIIGDFADFYSVSDHDRDPNRKKLLTDEVEDVNRELDRLHKIAGENVVYIEGNHEDRLRRYLWRHARKLMGIRTLDVPGLFYLQERGWIHRKYREAWRYGKVAYKHDVAGRAGKYAARASLQDFGGNVVIGHTHRGEVTYQGEAKGSSHFCLNVGWLGDVKQMDYTDPDKAVRDWNLGFGIVDYDIRGFATAHFIPILRNGCTVDRELIQL